MGGGTAQSAAGHSHGTLLLSPSSSSLWDFINDLLDFWCSSRASLFSCCWSIIYGVNSQRSKPKTFCWGGSSRLWCQNTGSIYEVSCFPVRRLVWPALTPVQPTADGLVLRHNECVPEVSGSVRQIRNSGFNKKNHTSGVINTVTLSPRLWLISIHTSTVQKTLTWDNLEKLICK